MIGRMRRPDTHGEVAQFVPKPSELAATIRRLALDTGYVGFSEHCIDRMEERGVSRLEAVRVLRGGEIRGEIEAGKSQGEWKCKVVAKPRGSRELGVVTVVVNGQRLFVKTVEWEDK